MLTNLDLAEVGQEQTFDYCIIGTGPAGLTCALVLAQPGTRIALLEAGDRDYSDKSQDAYKGEVIGDPYFPLDAARLRYFGGTSGHWGGRCRPLDDADFEAKPRIDWARWPITKADLDPYLAGHRKSSR